MRQLLLLTVCFLSFFVSSSAQIPDTFDIATFQPPPRWKRQTKDGVLIFSTLNEQKGTYAMITLYGSGESSGNAKSDFNSEWQQFVVGQLGIKGSPQIEPVRNTEGGHRHRRHYFSKRTGDISNYPEHLFRLRKNLQRLGDL